MVGGKMQDDTKLGLNQDMGMMVLPNACMSVMSIPEEEFNITEIRSKDRMAQMLISQGEVEKALIFNGLYMLMNIASLADENSINAFNVETYVFVTNENPAFFKARGILGIAPCPNEIKEHYSFGY